MSEAHFLKTSDANELKTSNSMGSEVFDYQSESDFSESETDYENMIMVDEKDLKENSKQEKNMNNDKTEISAFTLSLPNGLWNFTNTYRFPNNVKPISKENTTNPNYFTTATHHAMQQMSQQSTNMFSIFESATMSHLIEEEKSVNTDTAIDELLALFAERKAKESTHHVAENESRKRKRSCGTRTANSSGPQPLYPNPVQPPEFRDGLYVLMNGGSISEFIQHCYRCINLAAVIGIIIGVTLGLVCNYCSTGSMFQYYETQPRYDLTTLLGYLADLVARKFT